MSGRIVIDEERLALHIEKLQYLKAELACYNNKVNIDMGDCGGAFISGIEELGILLQKLQDALELLMTRTISYMNSRKASLSAKEAASALAVRQDTK